MAGLVQLYQRLSARATSYFLSADRSRVTRTVRTEITVEHEQRVWLIQEDTARPVEASPSPANPVRDDSRPELPSPSTNPHLQGEIR
jgi:hypothetical protein